MVPIALQYLGELRCEAIHGPSGSVLMTDAPLDNHGRAETFSPTDLVATALGTCMLTIMGIVARRHGWKLEGTTVHVEKHMVTEPVRRIGRLVVRFTIPVALNHDHRAMLERAAHTCPVHRSLHPDIELDIAFQYLDPDSDGAADLPNPPDVF